MTTPSISLQSQQYADQLFTAALNQQSHRLAQTLQQMRQQLTLTQTIETINRISFRLRRMGAAQAVDLLQAVQSSLR
jgi:hypothetical protein